MEKELKEYLRQCHGQTEEQIAAIERNATEADLEVLRKDMRSFLELSGGKMPEEFKRDFQKKQNEQPWKVEHDRRMRNMGKPATISWWVKAIIFVALVIMLIPYIFD